MAANTFSDLIILIPGILGSRLVRRQGGKVATVWNFSVRNLPRLLWEVARDGLVLTGNGVDPPEDGIEAAELFDFQVLPGFFGVDDYKSLLGSLGRGVAPAQVRTFPYDWRLSNRHAARRLETFAGDALKEWKAASGNANAKLWLVCHSMGGLVARYFCEALGGSRDTRAIVTMGTPHRGSVCALDALANGLRYGPLDVTALVRSLPSAYELLPLYRVLDVEPEAKPPAPLQRLATLFGLDAVTGAELPPADGAARAPVPTALAGLDRGMLQRALLFHAEIRVPAETRASAGTATPYQQRAFFNRRQKTPLSALVVGKWLGFLDTQRRLQGTAWVDFDARGDGTVPAFSAVPIEWKDTGEAVAVADKHVMMPATAWLADTIFNWMQPLDAEGEETKGGSVDDAAVVELAVPASVLTGEELTVSVAARDGMNARIEAEHMESGEMRSQPLRLLGDGEPASTTFAALDSGAYRVTARPADPRLPTVSDYVLVVDPQGY